MWNDWDSIVINIMSDSAVDLADTGVNKLKATLHIISFFLCVKIMIKSEINKLL